MPIHAHARYDCGYRPSGTGAVTCPCWVCVTYRFDLRIGMTAATGPSGPVPIHAHARYEV